MLQIAMAEKIKRHEVLSIAGRLERAISSRRPADPVELLYLRIAFHAALTRRFYHHEHVFCSQLRVTRGAQAEREARELGLSARSVVDTVAAWLDDWPAPAIAEDWERFRADTRTMLAGVREQVRRDGERMDALAQGVDPSDGGTAKHARGAWLGGRRELALA